jgi:UTP--glucose-1-phosphate uridylyltransferase
MLKPVKLAIIPLAGRGTRLYPASSVVPKGLVPLVDTDGIAKAAIQIMVEECINSGIEQVALVVSPGTDEVYRNYFTPISESELVAYNGKKIALEQSERLSQLSKQIVYFTQEEPHGFGHAVHCAKSFVSSEPFVVMLGDHVYISDTNTPCLKQALDVAVEYGQSVFGVHPIPEAIINRFGIVGGRPICARTYQVEGIIEKPTIEQARAKLRINNIPEGQYMAHFGIYVFSPTMMNVLDKAVKSHKSGEVQLTDGQITLYHQEPCLAYHPAGTSHDFGVPEGLLETQHKLGLKSPFAHLL